MYEQGSGCAAHTQGGGGGARNGSGLRTGRAPKRQAVHPAAGQPRESLMSTQNTPRIHSLEHVCEEQPHVRGRRTCVHVCQDSLHTRHACLYTFYLYMMERKEWRPLPGSWRHHPGARPPRPQLCLKPGSRRTSPIPRAKGRYTQARGTFESSNPTSLISPCYTAKGGAVAAPWPLHSWGPHTAWGPAPQTRAQTRMCGPGRGPAALCAALPPARPRPVPRAAAGGQRQLGPPHPACVTSTPRAPRAPGSTPTSPGASAGCSHCPQQD